MEYDTFQEIIVSLLNVYEKISQSKSCKFSDKENYDYYGNSKTYWNNVLK